MSLLEIRNLKSKLFSSIAWHWCATTKFSSDERTSPGWLLIKKTPVDRSTGETWELQNTRLWKEEVVPSAVDMAWFITTYYEVRGIRLFERIRARTSSLDPRISLLDEDRRATVGDFGRGLQNNYYWDQNHSDGIGLTASRKL